MMSRTAETFLQIEQQLAEERVSALTRIGKRLESILASLDELATEYRTQSGPSRDRVLDAYRRRRDEAQRYRWYLEVQRESVGMRRHQVLDRVYPLPPSRPDPGRRGAERVED